MGGFCSVKDPSVGVVVVDKKQAQTGRPQREESVSSESEPEFEVPSPTPLPGTADEAKEDDLETSEDEKEQSSAEDEIDTVLSLPAYMLGSGLSSHPLLGNDLSQDRTVELQQMIRAMSLGVRTVDAAAEERQRAAVCFPPITKANFEVVVKTVDLCAASVRKKKKKQQRRDGVYVKAAYRHKKLQTFRKTKKYSSLEHSADIVQIQETLTFALDIDDTAVAGMVTTQSKLTLEGVGDDTDEDTDDSDVEPEHDDDDYALEDDILLARIDLSVKQSRGRMLGSAQLAFGTLKLDEQIASGFIPRGGDWADIKVPLFDVSSDDFKSKRRDSKKRGEDFAKKRAVVGHLKVRCRLIWPMGVLKAFEPSVNPYIDMVASSLGSADPWTSSVPSEKGALMKWHSAQLKLTVLGVLMDADDADGYSQMTVEELKHTLPFLGKAADDSQRNAINDIYVTAIYKSGGKCQEHLTAKHSSRDSAIVFIGERLSFEVLKFRAEECEAFEFATKHPFEVMDSAEGSRAPGGVLLDLRVAKGTEHSSLGCCFLPVRDLFADVTLSADSLISDEFMFTKHLVVEDATGNLKINGAVFIKARFDWRQKDDRMTKTVGVF